jgi:2-haloacid dehalogenase
MQAGRRVQQIEAVVFDVGGVLLDWNPRYLYRKLFDDEDAMERFLVDVCTLDWHDAHDRGVRFDASCAKLAAAHPEQAELIWAWGRRSEEMIGGPIAGTAEVLRALKDEGIACYALTNMEAETFPLRFERFAFLGWFDGIVVSGLEPGGIAKPDIEIFQRLLDRFSLRAPATLMIDDAPRNLDAARRLGMPTLRFRSAVALRRRLEDAALLKAASR